jgi:hypothetical protein
MCSFTFCTIVLFLILRDAAVTSNLLETRMLRVKNRRLLKLTIDCSLLKSSLIVELHNSTIANIVVNNSLLVIPAACTILQSTLAGNTSAVCKKLQFVEMNYSTIALC